MSPYPENSRSHRNAAFLLGAVAFLSFIYFYEGGGWNQNSRFDLLRAIVERHTLQIDAYHENTQDLAHFNGHYYSDKAPGVVFLAVPVAVAARSVLQIAGVDPNSVRGEFFLSYVVGVFTIALPTAFAAVCLFYLGLRLGAGASGAGFAAIVMCIGTALWAYASLFWAHALVGACLIFGFAAALKLRDGEHEFFWALIVGVAAGWATVTEYPAAPASAALAFLALWAVGKRRESRLRVAAGIAIGAGICVLVLVGYLYAAFGSLRPSYAYYDPNSFSFMQQRGYLGLTYPHPDRLLKLLFGCSRGLLFASPVLVAAPVGLWKLWRDRTYAVPASVAAGIATYYFLFNASFYWWKAGLSFGPRYAGACIPLLCLGLAVSWSRAGRAGRGVLLILAACGVFVSLMAVSTTSQLSMQDSCPIVHSTWPAFWSGHMAINRDSMLIPSEAGSSGRYGAFNLGQLLGLQGLASLVPLLLAWAIAGFLWMRIRRQTA